MSGPDRVIRWSTAAAVIGVPVVTAVVFYEHACPLVHAHGKAGWTARLIPLTVDGLIWGSSMVMRGWRSSAGPGRDADCNGASADLDAKLLAGRVSTAIEFEADLVVEPDVWVGYPG